MQLLLLSCILVLLLAHRAANLRRKDEPIRKQCPVLSPHSPAAYIKSPEQQHSSFLSGKGLDLRCFAEQVLQEHQNLFSLYPDPILNQKVQSLTHQQSHPPRKPCSCSPWGVDPDDIQVTEVDALLVQPAVAGTSLGPGVHSQVGLQQRMAHTCSRRRKG